MRTRSTGFSRMPESCVLVAAGGTGGHLFPAEALAEALMRRGVPVELATDDRAVKYGAQFRARAIHAIPAATPTGGGAMSKAKAAAVLARGVAVALGVVWKARPMAVVGFGGYPTVPPLLAATILGAPTILHEQNAVMGRANRFLAGRVDAIATGFETLGGVSEAIRAKARHTGNPVRPAVIAAAQAPFPAFDRARLRVLVTGGSQGAKVMSDIVPAAMELLGADMRARIGLVQQARGEDETRVREIYARLGMQAEIAPFFSDLPARMGQTHLVVARSGASTVSELAVIGRPSILVPFPHAIDQDQAANAAHLAATGAALVVPQPQFTPQFLANALIEALADPQSLTKRAEAARSAGIADAADRLAELVLDVAARKRTNGV